MPHAGDSCIDIMSIAIAGETLQLLPQRAAYWPAQRMLLIADAGFGTGVAAQLARLDMLIAQHRPAHLLFLGDFLQAGAVPAGATLDALQRWRDAHAALRMSLVRGDPDEPAGLPPPALGIELREPPFELGPFSFCHRPHARAQGYVLAGHLRPLFRLSADGDSVRLPCFVFGAHGGILPAFGDSAAGFAIDPQAGERVYVCGGEAVQAVVHGASPSFGPPA